MDDIIRSILNVEEPKENESKIYIIKLDKTSDSQSEDDAVPNGSDEKNHANVADNNTHRTNDEEQEDISLEELRTWTFDKLKGKNKFYIPSNLEARRVWLSRLVELALEARLLSPEEAQVIVKDCDKDYRFVPSRLLIKMVVLLSHGQVLKTIVQQTLECNKMTMQDEYNDLLNMVSTQFDREKKTYENEIKKMKSRISELEQSIFEVLTTNDNKSPFQTAQNQALQQDKKDAVETKRKQGKIRRSKKKKQETSLFD